MLLKYFHNIASASPTVVYSLGQSHISEFGITWPIFTWNRVVLKILGCWRLQPFSEHQFELHICPKMSTIHSKSSIPVVSLFWFRQIFSGAIFRSFVRDRHKLSSAPYSYGTVVWYHRKQQNLFAIFTHGITWFGANLGYFKWRFQISGDSLYPWQ